MQVAVISSFEYQSWDAYWGFDVLLHHNLGQLLRPHNILRQGLYSFATTQSLMICWKIHCIVVKIRKTMILRIHLIISEYQHQRIHLIIMSNYQLQTKLCKFNFTCRPTFVPVAHFAPRNKKFCQLEDKTIHFF